MGFLISVHHLSKIESYVALAMEEGGTVVCGGKRPQLDPPLACGAFYLPTIVTRLATDSRCPTEKIFGPVVATHPFETCRATDVECSCCKFTHP